MKRMGLALLLALSGAAATAAPIYRCGQTYSQTPCPGGKVIDSSDPRTAAQRAEARRVTERQKELAAQMERDRLGEAPSAPASATSLDSRAAASAPRAAAARGKRKATKGSRAASGADIVVITPRPKAAQR